MSPEENKALVRRFIGAFNQGDLDAATAPHAPSFLDHSDPPGVPPNLEGHKVVLSMMLAAFPNMHVTLEDEIAEGDKVVTRFTMRGTHGGDFMGIPATGKTVTVAGIDILRLEDGQVMERWANVDALGMMQQLGVIPAPAQAG